MLAEKVVAATAGLVAMRLLLAHLPQPFGFYLVLLWAGVTLILCFSIFVIIVPVLFVVGRKSLAPHIFLQLWWYTVSMIWGIRLEVEGLDNLHGHGGVPGQPNSRIPCVAVANHQSELDFLIGGQVISEPRQSMRRTSNIILPALPTRLYSMFDVVG
jgi:hypothetical protein